MILSGIDIIPAQKSQFANMRLALVTNNVAATANGTNSRLHLLKTGFNILQLFSPEHGLSATGVDGASQPDITDPLTGLPVKSLYGRYIAPLEEDLKDIDAVLFDIPDVGCRFYTYLWTMTHVMEACALYGKKLIVLDRPNPIGADLSCAEGPMLDELHCGSFIGRWNIPLRHSCTLGELATFFAATRIKDIDLLVIKVKNWNRTEDADAASWKFTPASPAIKNVETALLYPGMGLLEGINVNEGRGTEMPFAVMGAPWIDAGLLPEHWRNLSLTGIEAKIAEYIPMDSVYRGELCYGLQLSVTDKQNFKPVRAGILLIQLLMRLFPGKVTERKYKTAANPSGASHLDKLLGIKNSFEKLQTGDNIVTTNITTQWRKQMEAYLLY